jgi:T-complex protein 1 subunit alpha
LENIRSAEFDSTKLRIEKILATGANVILTSKGIDDMALKYFVEAKTMACRRVPDDDLKRIADVTGARVLIALADIEGEETFSTTSLGFAGIVYAENLSSDELIVFENCQKSCAATILLRGANDYMLDEMVRSLHDALCVLKRVLEEKSIVPGGGAVEAALFVFLQSFSTTLRSREQLAVLQFAEAVLTIPKTLVVNAAKDATELVAKLCSYHYALNSQSDGKEKQFPVFFGLDLENGLIRDSINAGVLEPTTSKIKMIQFSTEAAITILRIDDLIILDNYKDTHNNK